MAKNGQILLSINYTAVDPDVSVYTVKSTRVYNSHTDTSTDCLKVSNYQYYHLRYLPSSCLMFSNCYKLVAHKKQKKPKFPKHIETDGNIFHVT